MTFIGDTLIIRAYVCGSKETDRFGFEQSDKCRIRELENTLARFGWHDADCSCVMHDIESGHPIFIERGDDPCSCGWREIRLHLAAGAMP